jgi:hypothetical protein
MIRNSRCVFTAILITPLLQGSPSKPVPNLNIKDPHYREKSYCFDVEICHVEEIRNNYDKVGTLLDQQRHCPRESRLPDIGEFETRSNFVKIGLRQELRVFVNVM